MSVLIPSCIKLEICPKLLLFTTLAAVVTLLCGLYPQESVAQDGDADLQIGGSNLQNSMLYQGIQSPTAASLGRFGDIPVGLYTGTPNVEVPLLELDDFGLSISLKYHSSGIKVSDIGGWVGMGWALQSGGVITRTVRGLPDDYTFGYYHTGGETESAWEGTLSGQFFSDHSYGQNLIDNLVDGEPDVFFFNINGRTGQFVVGPNGEADIRTVPDQNLRFEVTQGQPMRCGESALGGGFTEWQVTTEDGTKYVFSEIEMSHQSSGLENISNQQYVSSWHLSRIESPSGDNTVRFEYSGTGEWIEHNHPTYEQTTYLTDSDPGCYRSRNRATQIQRTCSPVLKKITTRNKEVRFASSPREDVDGGHKLSEITVHDRESGKLSTSFDFGYEYHADRLFLSEVQEIGADGDYHVPHTFEYDAPEDLPSDHASLAVDHWGYYNGASRNNSRNTQIPTQRVSTVSGVTTFVGAERRPNEDLTGRGVLNRINYPTGGHTHLEYEPHDYSMIGNPQETGLKKEIRHSDGVVHRGAGPKVTSEFEVESNTVVQFNIGFESESEIDTCFGPVNCSRITIYEDNEMIFDRAQPGSDTYSFSREADAGTVYILEAQTHDENNNAHVSTEWYEEVDTNKKLAGGVRIKRITEHNGVSTSEDVVTEYRYTDPEDENTSSGVLVNKPTYQTQSPGSNYGTCNYVELSSTSYRGLGSTHGSIVGYSDVQVIHSEHGQVQHSFRDPYEVSDYDVDTVAYPFAPPSSVDWKRGQEQSRQTLNADGRMRSEEEFGYNYSFHLNGPQRIYRAIAYKSFVRPYDGVVYFPHRYQVISRWVYPTSETVTHVGDNGEEARTTTTYTYEEDPSSPAFMQRRSEEVTTPEGTERTTTYEYAHEDHAPQMGRTGTHQLAEVYRTTVRNAIGTALRRSWTTWQRNDAASAPGWVPHEAWVWTGTD